MQISAPSKEKETIYLKEFSFTVLLFLYYYVKRREEENFFYFSEMNKTKICISFCLNCFSTRFVWNKRKTKDSHEGQAKKQSG